MRLSWLRAFAICTELRCAGANSRTSVEGGKSDVEVRQQVLRTAFEVSLIDCSKTADRLVAQVYVLRNTHRRNKVESPPGRRCQCQA